jgi:hypothetical protein
MVGVLSLPLLKEESRWPSPKNTKLIRQALAYVIELYHELTEENGAPTLGIQNQVVDFILADPELSRAVLDWRRASKSTK